ncbi:flagellar filament capping protein FliD [Lysinibacillus sphaericus]|uniref:Flagellar hook-associated protein 2 n=1 Tax=Lysinibacillus sphaericus OT4b.31 TaxID=1285586 RepID=R7ZH46_LYSSH|nr:flagellar filament capping protein FliD [Lysinibacillus sphaericus]EON73420.1 flagellar hook-associated 2 domain-containing protein [Lysinibacillus sphaericus OT4b.31]
MVNRIGGLASGMDIDSIVAKLMSAERAPLYKMQQKKTIYEWQRDAYRGVNTKIKAFDQYLFDNFRLSSNFVKKSSTITGSNTDKVSITAGTNASGSLNIQGVNSLASAAKSGAKTAEQTTYRNATDTDVLANIGMSQGNFNITVDGTSHNIEINGSTKVSDLVDQLVNAGFDKASYDEKTGKFSLGSIGEKKVEVDDANSAAFLRDQLGFGTSYTSSVLKATDPNDNTLEVPARNSTKLSDLGFSGTGTIKFTVNGEEKTVDYDANDPSQTIGKLVTDLNAQGIAASFNEKTGKFSMNSKDGKPIQFDDGNRGDLAKLGIHQTMGGGSKGFNQVEIATHGGPSVTPTGSISLQHLGLLTDGKFKLSAVQADGKMKDTIVEYKATDTIDSLMKKINSSGAGVTAMFSNGKMSISANNTGTNKDGATADIQLSTVKTVDENNIETHDESGLELFKQLGFNTTGTVGPTGETKVDLSGLGSNAKYKVNDLIMESQSNTVNIEGYTINLTGTFNADLDAATDGVTVTSTNDTDAMMTKIKEFVTTYNALITDLNGSLKETKYKSYLPLTTEQKEGMSESEIKMWEEKAKSGLLRNDSLVREGISTMRANFVGSVGGLSDSMIDSLAEIGITTSKDYTDGGKLVIDESKLSAALKKDSDQVSNIFIQKGNANDTVTDPNTGQSKTVDTRGIVDRLRDSIKSFELKIQKKAGRATMTNDGQYNIGKSMVDLDTRIERLQTRLVRVEERYWKQFTAMEQAINKANSQSGYLSQFGGQG